MGECMWSHRDENEGFKNCVGMKGSFLKAADGSIWEPLLRLCVQISTVDSTASLCSSLWPFSRSSFSCVCLSSCRGVALLFIALCLCDCSWSFLAFTLSLLVCLPCSSGLHFCLLKPWMLSPKVEYEVKRKLILSLLFLIVCERQEYFRISSVLACCCCCVLITRWTFLWEVELYYASFSWCTCWFHSGRLDLLLVLY